MRGFNLFLQATIICAHLRVLREIKKPADLADLRGKATQRFAKENVNETVSRHSSDYKFICILSYHISRSNSKAICGYSGLIFCS